MTPTPLNQSQRETVDEFGRLTLEVAALDFARNPKVKRLDELKPEICGWYPKLGANESQSAEGYTHKIEIGARSVVKTWKTMTAVAKAVGGWIAFRAICTVTFKAVAGVIGNTKAEALQVEEQTGYRKLKAVAILSAPCGRQLPPAA